MHTLRIHLLEIKYEFLKALRMPAYALPTLGFPLVFYVFFGLVFGRGTGAGVHMATYLLATYGCFGVIGASLFGFGVTVAFAPTSSRMRKARSYSAAKIAMGMHRRIASACSRFDDSRRTIRWSTRASSTTTGPTSRST